MQQKSISLRFVKAEEARQYTRFAIDTFAEEVQPKRKSINLLKVDELRRYTRFVYDTYYELRNRKTWLLWNIAVFRQEVHDVARGIEEKPVQDIFSRWQDVSKLAQFDPYEKNEKIRDFLKRYELSCLHFFPLERMVYEVIKLLQEADQAGWGLNVENFLRDRAWYELRGGWSGLPEYEKFRPARYIAGVYRWPHLPEEERKVQEVYSKNKLQYKQIAQYTSVYLPTEVDRLVLSNLKLGHNLNKKQRGECKSCLLDQVDPHERLRNYKDKKDKSLPAEIRDNLLLFKLGIFRRVIATETDDVYTPEIQCFPSSAETPKRLVKGERYFIRYDRRINGPNEGDPFRADPEAEEDGKKTGFREVFLEERKTYMEASGFSDLEHAIRAAIKRIEKMLDKVKRRYWQE